MSSAARLSLWEPRRPRNGCLSVREITDGLSGTLLLSEVIQGDSGTSKRDLRGYVWVGPGAGFTSYNGPNTPIKDVMTNNDYCDPTNASNPPCDTIGMSVGRPGKSPRGAAIRKGSIRVFATVPSVRFHTISIQVWRALSTTRGGEVVGSFDE